MTASNKTFAPCSTCVGSEYSSVRPRTMYAAARSGRQGQAKAGAASTERQGAAAQAGGLPPNGDANLTGLSHLSRGTGPP